MLSFEAFVTGILGVLLGTLVGAIVNARLTEAFQKRLLEHQLDFQKKQAEEDAKLRANIYAEWKDAFVEFRNMVNTRASQVVGQLMNRTNSSSKDNA